MSYITHEPFPPRVTIDPHETTFLTTCKNETQQGITFFPSNQNCALQLADRSQYLRNIHSNHLRATIFPGPYPEYTSTQLNIRRKAEILQYNQNALVYSKKQNWERLIANKLINKRVCLVRAKHPTPSTKSDVPPPRVDLFYDPDIPLYNYTPNPSSYNTFPYPDRQDTSLNFTSNDNVLVEPNNSLISITYINPSREVTTSSIVSPISISISGTYYNFLTDTVSTISTLQTLTLLITNTGTGELQYTYPISVATVQPMDVTLSNNGDFNATLYVGPISLSNISITRCPQYNYTFSLEAVVNTVQYDALSNIASSPFSIPSICYANIENNSAFFQTENNCVITTIPPAYIAPSFEES